MATDYDRFHEAFKSHRLHVVEEGEKVKAYYLKKPGDGRMGSTLLVFTLEGIALMGDLTPTTYGTISMPGYGLPWFSRALSPDYLATKFLTTRFIPEKAAESLQWDLDNDDPDDPMYDAEAVAAIKEVIRDLRDGDAGPERMHDALCGHMDMCDFPGDGYDPTEVGWLTAIQTAFAREYAKLINNLKG